MKNSKKIYAVNNQEDEDLESYILYPENADIDSKQSKLQQHIADSIERIKQRTEGGQEKKRRRI